MANTSTTIDQAEVMIRERITSNGKKEITGQALQDVLLAVTSGVKEKATENASNFKTGIEELRNELNTDLSNISSIEEYEIGKLFPAKS
jgi:DNA repair protein RadC